MDLELIRKQIDQVDQELVSLLEKRMALVEQVVAFKKTSGKPVFAFDSTAHGQHARRSHRSQSKKSYKK